MNISKFTKFALPLLFSTSCGGSGKEVNTDPPTIKYEFLLTADSKKKRTLIAYVLDPTNSTVSKVIGSIGPGGQGISIGPHTTDDSATNLVLQLENGGQLTIDPKSLEYSSTFALEPLGENPTFGVFGIPTFDFDVPITGTASYSGGATLQILDSGNIFDLQGDLTTLIDFSSSQLDINIDQLNGAVVGSDGIQSSVSDVASLDLLDVDIIGSNFSGGEAFLSSDIILTPLTESSLTQVEGGFFGPSGAELGGSLSIFNNSGINDLLIQGFFWGNLDGSGL